MTLPKYKPHLHPCLLLYGSVLLCSLPLNLRAQGKQNPAASSQALRDCDELMSAVRQRNLDKVRTLLDKGIDVECQRGSERGYGGTPLMAADSRSTEIVKLLVRRGANIDAKDAYFGRTALTQAALHRRLDFVKFLIGHGADVNVNCTTQGHSFYLMTEGVGPHNPTPLAEAVVGGDLAVVEYLIERGAKVDGRDGSSYTPLMWACIHGDPKVVQVLLRYGADASLQTDRERQPGAW